MAGLPQIFTFKNALKDWNAYTITLLTYSIQCASVFYSMVSLECSDDSGVSLLKPCEIPRHSETGGCLIFYRQQLSKHQKTIVILTLTH